MLVWLQAVTPLGSGAVVVDVAVICGEGIDNEKKNDMNLIERNPSIDLLLEYLFCNHSHSVLRYLVVPLSPFHLPHPRAQNQNQRAVYLRDLLSSCG
jgi:hypothetical protein